MPDRATVPMDNTTLLFLGIPLFVILLMKFPPMGPFMTELFPTAVRGTAQGFCQCRAWDRRAVSCAGGLSQRHDVTRRCDRCVQQSRLGHHDRDAAGVARNPWP